MNPKAIDRGAAAPTMDTQTTELLRALRSDLSEIIAPEVSSPMAKMIVAMAGDVLTMLIQDRQVQLAARREYLGARRRELKSMLAICGSANSEWMRAAQAALDDSAAAADPIAASKRCDSAIERLLPSVSALAMNSNAETQRALSSLTAALLGTTLQYEEVLARAAKADLEEDGKQRAGARAPVSIERLEAYWRERFPHRPHAKVTSLRELAGGFGKTTILFEVTNWESSPASLVMRRDVLGGATESSVIDEYTVLQAAFRHGLPAPEPIFLETDASKLDRPFMIVRKIAGEPAGNLWQASSDCTPQTGIDLADALGKLHSIDPVEFGSDANADARQQIQAYLQGWREGWRRKQPTPDPAVEASLCWLERSLPVPKRLCFVHADPGFWNLLISGGRLTGLLDWELGHLGDPAEDLSYVKVFVESFMPWADFLAAYRQAGGAEYDDAAGEFYDIFRDVRNAICSGYAGHAFRSGANPELRMAHCEIKSQGMLLMRAIKRIAERERGRQTF